MADPFSVQPPAWLVNVARPVNGEELGLSLAKGLSTLVGAFEKDPNAAPDASWLDSRKGLSQSAAEVSMAQIDPQWQVKGQEMANRVQMGRMQLAEQGAFLESQRRESSAWMNELPEVSAYISTPPEQLEGKPVPRVTSQRGLQAVQAKQTQAEQYKLRKAQQDNLMESRRLMQQNRDWQLSHGAAWQKHNQSVQESYLNLPPDERARVDAIPNVRSKNGVFSADGEVAINDALKRNNMPAIGQAKPGTMSPETKVQLDDLRADEADIRRRIDAKSKAGEPTDDLESELEDIKSQRRALAGGRPNETPAGTSDTAESREAKKLQHSLNVATASGDKKAIDAATKQIQAASKTRVLDQGGKLLPTDADERDKILSEAKPGQLVWDPVKGKSVKVDQALIDAATKSLADRKASEERSKARHAKERKEQLEQMGSAWQRMGTMGGF